MGRIYKKGTVDLHLAEFGADRFATTAALLIRRHSVWVLAMGENFEVALRPSAALRFGTYRDVTTFALTQAP